MIKFKSLSPTGLTVLLMAMAPALQAHPGHQHLEGAPGDMHLHGLLETPAWLVLLALVAVAVIGWGVLRLIRRRDQAPTRVRGQD
jgi:hypothetical protein